MNALIAKRDADAWPAAVRDERQELPGFWTFTVGGVSCSAHRLGTATIGGQVCRLWLVHAPRAVLLFLQGSGLWGRTLKQIAQSGAADELAAKAAWKFWLVDGTHATLGAVASFPWTFVGAPAVGVDGAMTVTVLVRPTVGQAVLGDPEDYDGAEASL